MSKQYQLSYLGKANILKIISLQFQFKLKQNLKFILVFYRPENTLRKLNIDRMFAKSFLDDMKSLDLLFGPDALLYLSIDDKARVPIGLAAANKQVCYTYRVTIFQHLHTNFWKNAILSSITVVQRILVKRGRHNHP